LIGRRSRRERGERAAGHFFLYTCARDNSGLSLHGMLRLGLSTAVVLLIVSAAFGQGVARKPLPTEPLEKYDNSPALAAPLAGISAALASSFGPYTSYQVNVDANGNNRVGDAANEPSLCVDRNNRNRMSIGWRQ